MGSLEPTTLEPFITILKELIVPANITICIPTYNAASTLSETLESLLQQTVRPSKIKIIDNKSEDKTFQIAEDYAGKYNFIEAIQNEANLGGEGNFNRCLEMSEGDYTGVFHADDIYSSRMLEEQVAFLKNNTASGVLTHAALINEKSETIGHRFVPPELLKRKQAIVLAYEDVLNLVLKYGNFLTCPSALVKTSIYRNEIKTWNGEKYKTSTDLDVWLRLSQLKGIGFIPEPLMNYRVFEGSFSVNLAKARIHRHDLFLVLDDYVKEDLTVKQKRHYKFLKYKDNFFREFNMRRQGKKVENLENVFLSSKDFIYLLTVSSLHRRVILIRTFFYFFTKIFGKRSTSILRRMDKWKEKIRFFVYK